MAYTPYVEEYITIADFVSQAYSSLFLWGSSASLPLGSPLDQGADILYLPNGSTRTKFYRFRVAPGFDACPPRGFSYGDDGGNWWIGFGVSDDLREA